MLNPVFFECTIFILILFSFLFFGFVCFCFHSQFFVVVHFVLFLFIAIFLFFICFAGVLLKRAKVYFNLLQFGGVSMRFVLVNLLCGCWLVRSLLLERYVRVQYTVHIHLHLVWDLSENMFNGRL